jgi:hypothetical protein
VVAGEETTPLQRAVAFADFGNGLSRALDFRTHLFVNTDLTVHLHREPAGEWVALDARTDLDGSGAGQATSILRDETGRAHGGSPSSAHRRGRSACRCARRGPPRPGAWPRPGNACSAGRSCSSAS